MWLCSGRWRVARGVEGLAIRRGLKPEGRLFWRRRFLARIFGGWPSCAWAIGLM